MHLATRQAICAALGKDFVLQRSTSLSGGCINRAFCLEGEDGRRYFVKLNEARYLPMFVAESLGLAALSEAHGLRVPQPIAQGVAGAQSFLLLEWLALRDRGEAGALGEGLAALHRVTASDFGFSQDNFIGTTPQPNGWQADWVEFWRVRRLGYQLGLAAQNGHRFRVDTDRLLAELPAFFRGYTPRPALLHGDLWRGNHGYLAEGTPVLFDPAAYFGDREAELAMTELFGGFSPAFYAAYRAHAPLDAGYAVRRELYNLYHILNHANLFGAGYVAQAEAMMVRLLAELG